MEIVNKDEQINDKNECKRVVRTYPADCTEEYWGIGLTELHDLEAKFCEIAKTNPELGKDLLSIYEDLMRFNIPIVRYTNGIDFVLTTDTGRIVGNGKFIEPLKDVSIESFDYYLSEEASEEEVDKALGKNRYIRGSRKINRE